MCRCPQLQGYQPDLSPPKAPGRLAGGIAHLAAAPGGILCISAYFEHSAPLFSEINAALVERIGEVVRAWGSLYVIQADWNREPQEVTDSGFQDTINGAVVAPTVYTHSSRRVYDFFIISRGMLEDVVDCRTLADWRCAQHRPVRLRLKLVLAAGTSKGCWFHVGSRGECRWGRHGRRRLTSRA